MVGTPTQRLKDRDKVLDAFVTTRSHAKEKGGSLSRKGKKKNRSKSSEHRKERRPTEEGLPKEMDPDYDRDNPKYYAPDIYEEVKAQIAEMMEKVKPVETEAYIKKSMEKLYHRRGLTISLMSLRIIWPIS